MFKKIFNLSVAFCLLFGLVLQAEAAADVATNSSAWARNNVDNTDISTTGANVDTAFTLASDNDKIEVAVMIRNTGDAVSGAIELWRTGDLDTTYVNNTLRKYQSGSWTDLNASWSDFNTEGTKLNLGTIGVDSYIRVVYQLDVGGSHNYGDLLQDYIRIYEGAGLVKTLTVGIYVPYLEVQTANSGDDSIVINSAVELLESVAETIGNFEVSSNGGGSFTTLTGPSNSVYLSSGTGRTITINQAQVDFDTGDNVVVRMSNLKTADDLRFLNPTDFTSTGNVSTASFIAIDTTAPTFTVGLDSIAGANGTLLVTFNEPMNVTTLTNGNVLARTTFNNGNDLGTAPTVAWTSTSTLKIFLDSDGDVVAGDTLIFDSNVTDANGNAVNGGAVVISTMTLDAPTIDTFVVADQTSSSTIYTNSATVDVTSFTASDSDGTINGYLVNENAATPSLANISNGTAPATYTVTGGEGLRTIYAWVKDDDDHIIGTSTGITLDLTNPIVTANVASGTYNSARTVTLSFSTETNPDKIYYTLDGSDPDDTDTQYTVPLSINSNTTLKFIAYDLAGNASAIVTRNYVFACNPNSVSNGTVAAYPGCALSCNSGYVLSGNSCVSTGGGGGGGGGGASVDTTTIYTLPNLSSTKTVETYRPIEISGSLFTRPVEQTDYYTSSQATFDLETEVLDLGGNSMTGAVIYPIKRVKAEEMKKDSRIPYPENTLIYSRYYKFGDLEKTFSKDVEINIHVTNSVLSLDTEYNIYKWVPTEGSVTGDDGVIYRAGEWVLMGDSSLIDEDGILSFTTTHSTLIAFTKVTEGENTALTPFVDIAGHWAQGYIENLYLRGIVNGKTATIFAPNDNLTRAELTKIALKSFDIEIPNEVTEKPFNDVELDAWYVAYVSKAKETGALSGYADGTFRPNQAINRAEALKILLEAAGVDTTGYEASFLDTDPNAWYASYIAYAKEKGIVEGYSVEFNGATEYYFKPEQFITRAEIAKIAMMLISE